MLVASKKNKTSLYQQLRKRVEQVLLHGQARIERQKVQTYWETGKLIYQHILTNKDRADYGKKIILQLSEDLEISDSVLRRTVQFYQSFPISATQRKLTWQHYVSLLPVRDEKTRLELVHRAEKGEWSCRELANKVKTELWDEADHDLKVKRDVSEKEFALKAQIGSLYTYQLIQPDQVSDERPYVLIDLGFETCLRLYQTGLKAGDIIESAWMESKKDYKIEKSKRAEAELFTYKAVIERIVDGDTLRVKIDLGFDLWVRQYLRLRGLDCPEIFTEAGKKSKNFVQKHLAHAPFVLIKTTRSDKYDRYLADLWIPDSKTKTNLYLNQMLLNEHLAVRA